MKKCKFCKSEIDDAAVLCPICKRQQNNVNGCLVGLVVFIVIIAIVAIIAVAVSDSDGGTTTTISGPSGTVNVSTEQTVDLKIVDASISEDVLGQNQIKLTVKNDSEYTIDAFDFEVQAYNSYGEKVSNWAVDSFTKSDVEIAAGSEWGSGNSAWTIYFADTAMTFKVHLTRYHIKETNETVDIHSDQRIYVEVRK